MKFRTLYHGYWMQRYLTRALMETRIFKMYRKHYLDHPKIDAYLPVDIDSFAGNIKKCRDNCHLVRDVICDEAWIQLNELWLWMSSGDAAREHQDTPDAFCDVILNHGHLIEGLLEETLRRDEFFHILRMGKYLEKTATQTEVLLQFLQKERSPEQCIVLLEFFYAKDSFYKLYSRELEANQVLHYLVADPLFPNSLKNELLTLTNSLQSLGIPHLILLSELLEKINRHTSTDGLIAALSSLHEQIDGLGTYLSVEHFQELVS